MEASMRGTSSGAPLSEGVPAKLPPIVTTAQSFFRFGLSLTEAQWGEVPLGAAMAMERQQLRRSSPQQGTGSRRHSKRHPKERREKRQQKGDDGVRKQCGSSDAWAAQATPPDDDAISSATNINTAATMAAHGPPSLLADDVMAIERRLCDVLRRANGIAHGRLDALRNDPLKSISRETLLARHAADLPPRFLPPIQEEVERLREARQDNLRQWWLNSIANVADRISQSMPLCRGPPPGEAADDVGGSASRPRNSGRDGSSSHDEAASVLPLCCEVVDTPQVSAAARLLRDHPAFRSCGNDDGDPGRTARRLAEVAQTVCAKRRDTAAAASAGPRP